MFVASTQFYFKMLGFFRTDPVIKIFVEEKEENKKYREQYLKTQKSLFTSDDSVTGKLEITPPPGKSISHKGIMLQIVAEYRRHEGSSLSNFMVKNMELTPAGELKSPLKVDFKFEDIKYPCPSFYGKALDCVYYLQVVVSHKLLDFKVQEPFDCVFLKPKTAPVKYNENYLIDNLFHVEIVFSNSKYSCRECILGAAYFVMVQLRIVQMSLTIFRTERYQGEAYYIEDKTELKSFEILDGAPVRGDHIPIRLFLGDLDIWPYNEFENARIFVNYFIRLTLTDENGKKYHKKLKINFDRTKPEGY